MPEQFLTLRGPSRTGSSTDALWTAQVKFKQNQDPAQQWAIQSLFVGPATGRLMAPGTLFGYCIVRSLQINLGDQVLNFDRIDDSAAGTFEFPVLMQADPTAWTQSGELADELPECLCLAGQIPVSALQAHGDNPDWTPKFSGFITSPGDLTATSSGLWISGNAHLPWDLAALTTPAHFHVMVPLPNGGASDANVIVQLDRETQPKASADEFIASFLGLNAALKTGGNWSKLELSNPSAIPDFFWTVSLSAGAPAPAIQFGPGEMSLLLFGGEPGTDGTPQSFASAAVVPVFEASGDGTLKVQVTAGTLTSTAKAVYQGSPTKETFQIQNVKAGYDALTAASVLRQQVGLDSPLSAAKPGALWGCLLLEDGWAQLPFLNLSESIYASAFPPPADGTVPPASTAVLAGAASYGNDNKPAVSEQTWTVTITSGAGVDGTWILKRASGPLTVDNATATFFDPGVELNGFLWLGNEPPTAADALPSLSNWLAAVTMIPVRTPPAMDLTPSPWEIDFADLEFARETDPLAPVLGKWSFTIQAATALNQLVTNGFFPSLAKELADNPPLLWRRHPHLPAVQSLPLTQSLNPPNNPCPSRQLAPFKLGLAGIKPSGWTFSNGAEKAAEAWPRYAGAKLDPAVNLPMAALSLPGLSFDPADAPIPSQLSGNDQYLGSQYHHGLPYLDEIYALSQLSKPAEQSTPAALPPPPLDRPSFVRLWDGLDEKGFFARAEGDAALAVKGPQTSVSGLVEPLTWPVSPAFDESAYPGTLTLNDSNGGPALVLREESGLEGFTGSFNTHGTDAISRSATAATFQVTAGSLAAQGAGGKIRDQRGFVRQASALNAKVVDTPLTSPDGQDWILRTSLDALDLSSGTDAWKFWFRDLPLKPVEGSFVRDHTRSPAARGVNDPAALSPQWVHLSGYEWRMGAGATDTSLPLLGFQFVPLTLEKVEFASDASVHAVEVIGRLLLPKAFGVSPESEANRANAALLRFEAQATGLTLFSVAAAGIDPDRDSKAVADNSGHAGEWPLDGERDGARLFWDKLALAGNRIQVTDGTLEFFYWGKRWRTPITLTTSIATANITASGPARLESVNLTLDPASALAPTLFGTFVYEFGERSRTFVEVRQIQSLLDETKPAGSITLANSEGPILPLAGEVASINGSVQARWTGVKDGAVSHDWQLLPGMHLRSTDSITGFAAMTFLVNGFDSAAAPGAPDPLALQSAFSESIISCEWGEMLQEAASDHTAARVRYFGSSSGSVAAGFSCFFDGKAWKETLLLNGLLEVKSLISWPRPDLAPTPTPGKTDFVFTIPGVNTPDHPALDHARHTMRVLFDQHEVPNDNLIAGKSADHQIFTFSTGQGWQFLAVTEHQLANVLMSLAGPLDPVTVSKDRRWTTLQEVRLLTPGLFSNFLTSLQSKNLLTHDTDGLRVSSFHDASDLYGGDLLDNLLGGGSIAARPNQIMPMTASLIVEASAAHWIRLKDSTATGFTPLLFLPALSPAGASTSLSDFSASVDPSKPEWLMAVVPFLGRLQPASLDGIPSTATEPVPLNLPPLRVDPILQIGQARASSAPLPVVAALLASWEDAHDFNARVSPFELANDPGSLHPRRYFRLDAASLAESWFRIASPPSEKPSPFLTSILSTLPTPGPSRLGRPAALARIYEPLRTALPPAIPDPNLKLPDEQTGAPVDWRRNRLLLFQGFAIPAVSRPTASHKYRLFLAGAPLLSASFPNSGPNGPTYYPAASVLPTDSQVGSIANPMPVTLAVSPFLGFARRFPRVTNPPPVPLLEYGELMGTQPSGQVDILANQLWIADPIASPAPIDPTAWANDTIQRIAPDSRVALLRVRRVLFALLPNNEKTATVSYEFQLLTPPAAEQIDRIAHPIRAQLQRLRFPEGQYGGPRTPARLRDFEAAPPQIRDVQPLRFERRPDQPANDIWPWGFSALRLRIRTLENAAGITGAAHDQTKFWWQAVSHTVQFAAGQADKLQLPPLFRAQAIGSLLPSLPDLKLPSFPTEAEKPTDGNQRDDPWQPMLPGSVDWLADGARPGAGFVFRTQLLRQTGTVGEIVDASGAIPVQHRMPRPVPLRPNLPLQLTNRAAQRIALRTWASFFDPDQLLLVGTNPSDTAFFAPQPDDLTHPPAELKVTLASFVNATIPTGWDSNLAFNLVDQDGAINPPPGSWDMEVILESQGAVFAYTPPVPPLVSGSLWKPADSAKLLSNLGSLSHGDEVTVTVRLEYKASKVAGYKQRLHFPLRIAKASAFPLPIEPVFAVFEDPEYNRSLVSNTAHGEGIWVDNGNPRVTHRIRVSMDRREYNAGSALFALFTDSAASLTITGAASSGGLISITTQAAHNLHTGDRVQISGVQGTVEANGQWVITVSDATHFTLNNSAFVNAYVSGGTASFLLNATLVFSAVRRDGVVYVLETHTIPASTLQSVSIADAFRKRNLNPVPGDVISCTLYQDVAATNPIVSAQADIVTEPVTPTPDAAYALLSRNGNSVECARFAWSPLATRIDLVNPEDLEGETVRRRAVFNWAASARPSQNRQFSIQKLSATGATHLIEQNLWK